MKFFAQIQSIRNLLPMLLLSGFSSIYSQVVESNEVGFDLNNLPDKLPPSIRILSPVANEAGGYLSEVAQLEIIGEVKDESKIRFVSINSDIRMANESGIFASQLSLRPGENVIQIKAMDEYNNIQNQDITIEYRPLVLTLEDRINTESKYFGLFIGIDHYDDPEIPSLDNPIGDAERLINTLTQRYTFNSENIRFLRNPTRGEIIVELDLFREKVSANDNFLIFFAGHGYWDDGAKIGYWLPSDATKRSTVDWFRNSTLVDYLQAINSKHTLLITDACFAGSIFKTRSALMNEEKVYEKLYARPSRTAMTSSGPLDEVPDRSAFLRYLIQRLDENNETYLSSEELFSSFKMAVISNTNVVPQYGVIRNVGNEGGDFIFLKRK